jgi:glycosyltransferase involved in cell wall biosynthesis
VNIWINSCHAALEYDNAKTFTALGHKVSGLFDVGSKQRPKIPGVTDVKMPDSVHESNKTASVNLSDVGDPDVVVVHQTADYPQRVEAYARQNKSAVISIIFGQGNPAQHNALARVARYYPNVFIVVYALKEFSIYTRYGAPADRLKLIRFGKPQDDFDPDSWTGTEPVCFCPCNSVHQRGDGCNWSAIQLLLGAGLPLKLGGKDTEQVGGLGELTFDEYREWLKKSYCYLHVGTIPAPYTLTLVEAACSGTPIIALNNGHGLAGEGFSIDIADKVENAASLIQTMLSNDGYRQARHDHSVYLARTAFSGDIMNRQWDQLLKQIEVSNGKG